MLAPHRDLDEAPIRALLEQLERSYDPEYGGFGDAPKFPQPEVHELLLSEWRLSGNQSLYEMTARTMLNMARGGTYDHVEGGFFRYSTTRDWSVPHFEKMAEDHAGLLRVLAMLVRYAPTGDFRATLVSASRYVRTVLRDPQSGFFAGSQDAEEAYYELPLEERRARESPYVDRTSYTNWTCALAGSLALVARALDDDALLAETLATLDAVHDRLRAPDGLLYHVLAPGAQPAVRGLLTDQVAYARALLDAHELSGEGRYVARALEVCDAMIRHFQAEDGGFFDRLPTEESLGRLAITDRPIVENGLAADVLLRLAALTGEQRYRESAQRVLQLFAPTAATAGPFAAHFCRALRRGLQREVSVRIVGESGGTDEFREAAMRLPSPLTAIRTLSADEAEGLAMPREAPAAYVCVTGACGAPVREAASLRAAYDALVK